MPELPHAWCEARRDIGMNSTTVVSDCGPRQLHASLDHSPHAHLVASFGSFALVIMCSL
jgi:hypothetical protein